MAKGFKVADAYIEVHLDDDTAKREVAGLPGRIGTDTDRAGTTVGRRMGQSIDKSLGNEVDKSGRKNGDKLSQGIHLAVVRNSPLIAAGIGAALSAGAPVAIAGATALFAGIGIVAAAQNEKVQKAWSNTWDGIVAGTEADASVLQGTLINMAGQVSAGFERLRPALRDVFAATAPLLESFTGSLMQAAQNAMPGLVRAVQNAGPVFDGLGSLVEDIGTGLGKFFDIISQHSEAAGTAFEAIGQIVGTLLPILGDLLGQGAELAADVLPPIASALGLVGDALHVVAPLLPAVALGFGAFKILQTLSGPMQSFAGSLATISTRLDVFASDGGRFAATAGRMAGATQGAASSMSKLGAALPLIGIATAGLTVALSDSAEQQDKVTTGLEGLYKTVQLGGPNAAHAQELLNAAAENGRSSFLGLGADTKTAMTDAKASTDAWWNSLTPLQQAQEIVTARSNDLNVAIQKYGEGSPQAVAAAGAYRAAQGEVAAQSAATQLAINGVTDAMIAQANQALAASGSSLSYQAAQIQLARAQENLSKVQADGTSTALDIQEAQLQVAQASQQVAQTAGDAAQASSGLGDTLQGQKVNAQAALQELYHLRDTMGSEFPPALQAAITGLERSGAAAGGMSVQAMQGKASVDHLLGSMGILGQQHPVPTVGLSDQASAGLQRISGLVWSLPSSRTIYMTTVMQTIQRILPFGGGSASGGAVNDMPVIKAASGRIVGPGTGTSDSVPAIGPNGQPWALSNGEWVIRASAVKALENAFGPAAMPTINSGQLPSLPAGRTVGGDGAMTAAAGNVIVNVTVNGVGFADSVEFPQRLTETIRKELIKADRRTR